MARHCIRLGRMIGKCVVFANSLKRIGKWLPANTIGQTTHGQNYFVIFVKGCCCCY
jgi:hypothetical protein